MNSKYVLPAGDPEHKEPEYICPSASWRNITGLIPSGTDNDSAPAACKAVFFFIGGKK